MSVQDLHPDCLKGISELRTTVAVMERDIVQHSKVTDKLSEAVEKIQEMNGNLCRIIGLHELKIDGTEKLHQEIDTDLKEMNLRVNNFTETKVPVKTDQQLEIEVALAELTKWKYIFTGAAIVLGYLLGHINWVTVLSFLKG